MIDDCRLLQRSENPALTGFMAGMIGEALLVLDMDRKPMDAAKKRGVGLNRLPVFFLAALAAVVMVLLPACGKKGPPFLPEKKLVIKVDRLTGKWENGKVRLEGYIGGDDKRRSDVTGCRIYHTWYPMDNPPCEGCPIEMADFRDIKEMEISGDLFTCEIPGVKKKGVWFFELRLIGRNGALGPPSERVKVTIDAPVK